jgi:hypothetical protein
VTVVRWGDRHAFVAALPVLLRADDARGESIAMKSKTEKKTPKLELSKTTLRNLSVRSGVQTGLGVSGVGRTVTCFACTQLCSQPVGTFACSSV